MFSKQRNYESMGMLNISSFLYFPKIILVEVFKFVSKPHLKHLQHGKYRLAIIFSCLRIRGKLPSYNLKTLPNILS
jgi:hypothetical protein